MDFDRFDMALGAVLAVCWLGWIFRLVAWIYHGPTA